jgi:hypothetical protein
MTEQTQKKGLPRGCVIGLIVAGAVLLLVIALFVVCSIYRDDLIKFSITNTLGGMKKAMATAPIPGVEAESVDSILTTFTERFDTVMTLDYDRLQPLVVAIQTAATSGGKFDSATVYSVVDGIVKFYPDLGRFLTPSGESAVPMDAPVETDSAASTHQ